MGKDQLSRFGRLQGLLLVARAGSPSAAARLSGLQPSTLYRQVDALERETGGALFTRRNGRWTPTPLGTRLVDIAADLENRLRDFGVLAAARNSRLAGLLRVTASDALSHFYLAPRLAGFRARHPGLSVELLTTNRRLDLASGEADVAFRAHSKPGDGLVGRRVGRILHAVYGADTYLAGKPLPRSPQDLHGHAVLRHGEELSHFSAAQWTEEAMQAAHEAGRFNTVTDLARATEGGLGLSVLPCFVGRQLAGSRLLFMAGNGLPADLWLLCHESQRKAPKVKAFLSHFAETLKADAQMFGEG